MQGGLQALVKGQKYGRSSWRNRNAVVQLRVWNRNVRQKCCGLSAFFVACLHAMRLPSSPGSSDILAAPPPHLPSHTLTLSHCGILFLVIHLRNCHIYNNMPHLLIYHLTLSSSWWYTCWYPNILGTLAHPIFTIKMPHSFSLSHPPSHSRTHSGMHSSGQTYKSTRKGEIFKKPCRESSFQNHPRIIISKSAGNHHFKINENNHFKINENNHFKISWESSFQNLRRIIVSKSAQNHRFKISRESSFLSKAFSSTPPCSSISLPDCSVK